MVKKEKSSGIPLGVPDVFMAPGSIEAVRSLSAKENISLQESALILCYNELRLIHSHFDAMMTTPVKDKLI